MKTGDQLSLTVDVRPWTLYAVNLLTDDPDNTIRVADLVSQVSIRNAMFAMASSYPLDSVIELVEVLEAEETPLTAEDARDLNGRQLRMFDDIQYLESEVLADPSADRGTDLTRRLAARRLARADVERRRSDEMKRRHEAELRERDRALEESRSTLAQTTRERDDAREQLGNATSDARHAHRKLDRRSRVWRITGVAGFLLVAFALGGWLNLAGGLVGALGIALWTARGLLWADSDSETERALLLDLVWVGSIEAVALILGAAT